MRNGANALARYVAFIAVLTGALAVSCHRRTPPVSAPGAAGIPPPPRAPETSSKSAKTPDSVPDILPPKLPPHSGPVPAPPVATEQPPVTPPPPHNTRRTVRHPAAAAQSPAGTQVPAPATPGPAAPAPELQVGALLTPEQERMVTASIEAHLRNARQILRSIAYDRLTRNQQASYVQVQGLITRAEQARKSDLSGAESLSQRADLLAVDLERSAH